MSGKTRRWLIVAIGLLSSFAVHAGSPVWAIRGQHNTVYIAGSVHLLKAESAQLPAAFDRAYAASKIMVMELDLDSLDPMEAGGWVLEHGMLPEGTTLSDVIGADRYDRVEAEAARLGVPIELLGQMKPWALGVQLLELQYAQLGFDPSQGVELQLMQRARKDGKDVEGLETLPEQLGALDNLSKEDQVKFLDLIVNEMHEVESETHRIVAAWRNGDTAKLAAELTDEYRRFPTLYHSLVTERNKRWLPKIRALLDDPHDYFVVVGALHLVGEDGLLEMMRREGRAPSPLN